MTRILIIAMLWPSLAWAPFQTPDDPRRVDDALLLQVICTHETRGESRPEWAVSRPEGTDWGMCQVQYWSAVHYGGYARDRSPGDLFIPETNRAVARAILAEGHRRLMTRYGHATLPQLAYWYNAGELRRIPPRTRYVRDIAQAYAAAHRSRAFTQAMEAHR